MAYHFQIMCYPDQCLLKINGAKNVLYAETSKKRIDI